MKVAQSELEEALQSRKLNRVTRALSELAEELAYQLKPPYTEVIRLKAEEDGQRYAIQFSARLHLHYSNIQTQREGLVFTVQFSGEAYADSPNPPIEELFATALVDSFVVFGYGKEWAGQVVPTPDQFEKNLEVNSLTLNRIPTAVFLGKIAAAHVT
jgi:hypothetical protein